MKIEDLRKLGAGLRAAFTCPTCGKSRIVLAVSHKGRGTGQHGASYYGPTAFEQVTDDTHCQCSPTKEPA